jgi:hypothetical protein
MNHVLESFLSLLSVSYLFAILMLVGEKLASKVSYNHTYQLLTHWYCRVSCQTDR